MTPGDVEPDRPSAWSRSVQRFLRSAVGPGEQGTTDGELVARFVELRDSAAFELLVWRHGGVVLRAAKAIVRDHHLAEDVTQAVFLVLAKQAGGLREPDALVGWLHVTARRLAVRAAKLRKPTVALPDLASPVSTIELHPEVEEEVARLPERWRMPVLLCFYEGLTHEEAAVRLGRPVGTIAGWLARAKVRLHDRLTARGLPVPVAGLPAILAVDRLDASLVEAVLSSVSVGLVSSASISPTVSLLVAGAIRDMTILKLKFAAAAVLAAGTLGVGSYVTVNAQQGRVTPAAAGKPLDLPPASTPLAPPPGGVGLPTVTTLYEPAVKPAIPLTLTQSRRSMANLKTILTGFLNYESACTYFPTNIYGKAATPLLSWRVALLPYIGEEKLYKEFKLDEPWDSEHNFKLLAKMPDVYRVGIEGKDATHTYYQIVDTPGTAFVPRYFHEPVSGTYIPARAGGEGGAAAGEGGTAAGAPPGATGVAPGKPPAVTKHPPAGMIRDIVDGLSNTFAVLECGPAVPWTKPVDLTGFTIPDVPAVAGAPIASKLPAHWVFPFGSVFHASTADGAAYALKREMPDPLWTALITAGGGEILDIAYAQRQYHLRLPAATAEEKAIVEKLKVDNAARRKALEATLKQYLDAAGKAGDAGGDFFTEEEIKNQLESLKRLLDDRVKELEKTKQAEKK